MDLLTQVVLGAACGEAALGKKIGNKAVLFGAIGGTIPDWDVFIGNILHKNEIDAMLFHRGFMHSLFFAVIAAFALGFLVHKLYDKGKRKHTTTQRDWIWLFFLSIFTHPILDSFTGYGTQLFAPFSNYRVALNTISIADPLYTAPFLICLIILMWFRRNNPKRRFWLKLGLIVSSVYMLLTVFNKLYINSVFEKSLQSQNVSYDRFMTAPTILNNVLWYGIAESDTGYHIGFYSLFDEKNEFSEWQTLPKNHELISRNHPDLQKLAWFSDDYYNLKQLEKDTILYSDVRFPLVDTGNRKEAIFNFKVYKDGDRLNMKPFAPGFRDGDEFKKSMKIFWERIKGK